MLSYQVRKNKVKFTRRKILYAQSIESILNRLESNSKLMLACSKFRSTRKIVKKWFVVWDVMPLSDFFFESAISFTYCYLVWTLFFFFFFYLWLDKFWGIIPYEVMLDLYEFVFSSGGWSKTKILCIGNCKLNFGSCVGVFFTIPKLQNEKNTPLGIDFFFNLI